MKRYLKSVFALTLICAVIGIALAATNMITLPIIKVNEAAAVQEMLEVVMPGGTGFEIVETENLTLPGTVTEVYCETGGGYVFKLETSGYASGMVILCGVDKNGLVTGATCMASGETLGYEKTYGNSLVKRTLNSIDSVDTVASATKTTSGYKNAVKDALNAASVLNKSVKGGA
ncbi:MAG: FMN-binding protein [Clostridia bacterium]|nr:FMN-binding protein [Clostridia bacterium]